MTRDHRRLEVFQRADDLAVEVFRTAAALPACERYGLQAQLRRAAVSVPANIVEGSARPTLAEYCRFLGIALASAREVVYLLGLARRLGFLHVGDSERLERGYGVVQGMLHNVIRGLERRK